MSFSNLLLAITIMVGLTMVWSRASSEILHVHAAASAHDHVHAHVHDGAGRSIHDHHVHQGHHELSTRCEAEDSDGATAHHHCLCHHGCDCVESRMLSIRRHETEQHNELPAPQSASELVRIDGQPRGQAARPLQRGIADRTLESVRSVILLV